MVANTSIKIQLLGTGTSTGIPMIGCQCQVCKSLNPKDNRLRSSILVQSATTTLVVDTTPDFRYQMLRTNTTHLDAVVYTHPHKDHMAGLDDITRKRNPLTYEEKKGPVPFGGLGLSFNDQDLKALFGAAALAR